MRQRIVCVLFERSHTNRQVNDSRSSDDTTVSILLKLVWPCLSSFRTLIANLVLVRFRESYTTQRCVGNCFLKYFTVRGLMINTEHKTSEESLNV